jgi:sugar phosphate permease
VAAVPDVFESVYGAQITAPSLIDLFLITNVVSSFIVTDVVAKIGLQRAIQGSAVLMMIGCWLRSGLDFLPFIGLPDTNSLVSYPLVVVGTILVGISQPFFQCTPPLLSAMWFAPSERSTSTAIALNFNQVGIATAFLVGGAMAVDRSGLSNYMGLIAVVCTIVTIGTLLQFQNEPLIAPSISEMNKRKRGLKEPPFRVSVQRLFQKSGFTQALAAFICSISITNIIGAFIDEIMERGGIVEQLSIDLAGAGFEFAILLGGILIGGYVDRTKEYKNVTLACLVVTALLVIPLGLTEHQIGKEPILLIMALLVCTFVATA